MQFAKLESKADSYDSGWLPLDPLRPVRLLRPLMRDRAQMGSLDEELQSWRDATTGDTSRLTGRYEDEDGAEDDEERDGRMQE
ncbi:hypothetical protein TgHK011_006688 [Trichoderma gracile]|nr:hypothetical protein TgHK011_006688 [Trichoderma gracile]